MTNTITIANRSEDHAKYPPIHGCGDHAVPRCMPGTSINFMTTSSRLIGATNCSGDSGGRA